MLNFILILLNILFISTSYANEIISVTEETNINTIDSNKFEIVLKKNKYLIEGPQEKDKIEFVQDSLSRKDLESFLKTRIDFLTQAAKALQALKWGFGVGVLVKNHFQFNSEKKQIDELLKYSNSMDSGARDDIRLAIEIEKPLFEQKWSDLKNKTFSEQSNEAISRVLNRLDNQLWDQANIVANANEFGVLAAIGVEAEGGVKNNKGWGGLTDLGISIGFNRDDKSIAIQIFHDLEPYKSTQMPMMFIAGLVTKAGFYIANQEKKLTAKGTSFYPPMVPGFSSSTERSFMAGFSSGLTWPPSPLGDMLTYSNKLSQTTLVRISISRLTKGFIRIQSASLKQILKVNSISLKNLLRDIKSSVRKNQCSLLFAQI